MNSNIVIIGGGHAAAQLCAGLVEAGQGARIHMVCEETAIPYHRPPLSKTFLKSPDEVPQQHRAEVWYADAGITLHLGDAAQSIDRQARTVTLKSGAVLRWERLVLATGTRARRISALEGLENVALLRAAHEAVQLRDKLALAQHVTVLGGGFIGLEVAATALALGKEVLVLESAPRLLGRAVSPELSAHVLATHRAAGMDIRVGVKADVRQVDGNHLTAIEIDGQPQPIDLLLLGIGAVPEIALAQAAGLECADGVVVDAFMQTSDEAILAVGDCTRFPDQRSDAPLRLESVQNANDQARTAVATLTGAPRPHDVVPWFWSDQGSLRLQMAGLVPAPGTAGALTVRRPGANPASFSLLHYVGAQLRCVESVNAPVDHMMSRKLLEAGRSPEPSVAANPAVPLKSLLA
ncbi:3-phenylpropionate/trans-cinnamate dioxygenase ferredoxin reductase subunit [Variovorax sp. HW608]|uniref:NAD(P)/FAD-dependent oxidoreductase n=1 Tax=Variovorax sp. HW608 TaxID=1034889 RepID=UPI00081FF977|nr:FAD-dependent oxidoreductase [Variovorax sp. HW608]SCK47079.1 3-phenylpropionate/trans-cinnamate dioxygenase ferredoxin reductase subunit [Variovorax sp. HW608]